MYLTVTDGRVLTALRQKMVLEPVTLVQLVTLVAVTLWVQSGLLWLTQFTEPTSPRQPGKLDIVLIR